MRNVAARAKYSVLFSCTTDGSARICKCLGGFNDKGRQRIEDTDIIKGLKFFSRVEGEAQRSFARLSFTASNFFRRSVIRILDCRVLSLVRLSYDEQKTGMQRW